MTVAIGSTNPVKVHAVERAFTNSSYRVISVKADSGVSLQPLTQEETRKGALFRAKDAMNKAKAELGVGLEGGVFFIDERVYLCNWAALMDKEGRHYVVSGPTFLLPMLYKDFLLNGDELNTIMHKVEGKKDLGSKEGAIGFFTKGLITREDVFHQMVQILWGQYQYYLENKELHSYLT